MAIHAIPVVDLREVLSSSADLGSCPQVEQLNSAFSTIGFVFIKNHGIPRKLIDDIFDQSAQFFALPLESKRQYAHSRSRENDPGNDGYVCLEQECVDLAQPGDLKECFDVCALRTCNFPDQELPAFRSAVTILYESCISLSLKLVELMGYALHLPDPQYFVKAHQKMGQGHNENYTTMRVLYYPPLPPSSEIKPGQLRCGEHVDYGSVTLLFQDPNGGLQVKRSDGGYTDVPYMSDAILVNLGALMQQWTSDKYLATPHRVLLPNDEVQWRTVRQSMAFFVQPDNEVMVECIDGSNKYPPISAREDTERRLTVTYAAFAK